MPSSVTAHAVDVAAVLDRLCHRFPSDLVDAIVEIQPGRRVTAIKNVTVSEDYFQGHFPEVPVTPGVLIVEALAQVASVLLLHDGEHLRGARVYLRGVTDAKFRRQVVPGDQVTLEVELTRARGTVARVAGVARVGGQVVAEACLHMAVVPAAAGIHPTAIVHPDAVVGAGTEVGPHVTIGPNVRIGRDNRIGASCVIDGWTEIGDRNVLYGMGSYGQPPQDLKYKGEVTKLIIGHGNVFREFVTIHRGTLGGRGATTIGDRNYLMAYVHVAHDCLVCDDTILSHGSTLGGHVDVDDFATLGGHVGVHQFCRVGKYAFIGGFSACTKDVLPYSKTVGNRALNYGLNTIGLVRRGFTLDTVRKLKSAYRYLLSSKLNTSRALDAIEQDGALDCPEVRYLVAFVRGAKRGVVLKQPRRGSGDGADD